VYQLRGSESRTLDTLGTFRVVLTRDLVADIYTGDTRRFAQDLRSLQAQGLVARRTFASDRMGHSQAMLTLTDAGRDLLETHRASSRFSPDSGRPVYAGWGKPRELVHDASLYRMFQLEAERIANAGGTIQRVVLDDELKRQLYGIVNAETQLSAASRQARLIELAHTFEVPVVDGHVQLPDVRIEYETPSGEQARVDLELATDHYHAGHLAAKQRAGFTLYSAAGHVGRGMRSLRTSGGGGGASFDPNHLSGLLSL
jgi:DNA-binding MarR family transcriptional regulator